MSQPILSNFNWPTAAPGALNKFPSSLLSTSTAALFSAMQTLATNTLNTVSIHQIQPLNVHASAVATNIHTPMPDITVASFDLHTPPSNHLSPAPFNPTFTDPTFTVLTSQMTSSPQLPKNPTLSPSAIVGITLGLIAFLGILIGLALFFYCRRKPKPSPPDTEKAEPEETLAEKMERMREFRRRRNAANTAGKHKAAYEAAKKKLRDEAERARCGEARRGENKEVFVVGDGEEEHKENEKKAKEQEEAMQRQEMEEEAERRRARRPSGLRMHPPSASTVVTVVEAGVTPTRV